MASDMTCRAAWVGSAKTSPDVTLLGLWVDAVGHSETDVGPCNHDSRCVVDAACSAADNTQSEVAVVDTSHLHDYQWYVPFAFW